MARIAGVDLPREKRAEVGLTYIYGIGRPASRRILGLAGVDMNLRVRDLTDQQVNEIKRVIGEHYRVEGDLRTELNLNVKRLMDVGCFRGLRHRSGLPVRGQRTKTNARTRKGVRKTVAGRKKAPSKG
ncbi:MAG: 30S ribosomal protein S13 [Spirochaetales bacterium]|nr:30S ribosomal protein S13 [Spirochaetales bacterium]